MPRFALLRSTRVGGDIASKLGVTSFNLGLLQHGSLENHFTNFTLISIVCPNGFLFAKVIRYKPIDLRLFLKPPGGASYLS